MVIDFEIFSFFKIGFILKIKDFMKIISTTNVYLYRYYRIQIKEKTNKFIPKEILNKNPRFPNPNILP